jgi:hypothetical protein
MFEIHKFNHLKLDSYQSINVFFKYLYLQFGEKPKIEEPVMSVKALCKALGNVTIVQKGHNDIISDGENGKYRKVIMI